ncbi:hypothetical protein Hanom_Chr08g00736881 [Helianthus anomalus]
MFTAKHSLKGNWTSISKTASRSDEVKTFMTSLLPFSPWWCIGHQPQTPPSWPRRSTNTGIH